jgi:hypothetical protein
MTLSEEAAMIEAMDAASQRGTNKIKKNQNSRFK